MICKYLGHKFRPRYSSSEKPSEVEFEGGAAAVIRAMEASKGKTQTYHCDVCVRCGLVVNAQEGRP